LTASIFTREGVRAGSSRGRRTLQKTSTCHAMTQEMLPRQKRDKFNQQKTNRIFAPYPVGRNFFALDHRRSEHLPNGTKQRDTSGPRKFKERKQPLSQQIAASSGRAHGAVALRTLSMREALGFNPQRVHWGPRSHQAKETRDGRELPEESPSWGSGPRTHAHEACALATELRRHPAST
jgi:hypothetical protein